MPRVYTSCNCKRCRGVPSGIKRHHKNEAHRFIRRETKKAIKNENEDNIPQSYSSGYKD